MDRKTVLKNIVNQFKNPPNHYSPYAFWFWTNENLDEDMIAYQAEEMCRQGMSPGYIQSRNKCDKTFLSPQWFSAIDKVVQVAEKFDMPFGYCDDVGAPCGTVEPNKYNSRKKSGKKLVVSLDIQKRN